MRPKLNRARQGCNPNLALTPHQANTNKELTAMLPKNKYLSKASPWITDRNNSVFGYEMSIAEDPSCHWFSKPHPLFHWLNENNLNSSLFDALAKLSPLHPVVSYNGHTSLWLSPPPSGSGNAVGIIIGRDKSNKLRIIGTNIMNCPAGSVNTPNACVFEAFDSLEGNALSIYRLIENEISSRMTPEEVAISKVIEHEAYKYRTMPIYILAIDGDKSYFGIDTAVVSGDYPSDMSYEFAGEIL